MIKSKLQKLIDKTKNWYYVNSYITEDNFPVPKKIETKNPQLIELEKKMTSKKCLDLIKQKGLRPANIYELLEYKNNHELEKGKYYVAFGSDWTDSVGRHRVPRLLAHWDGGFGFGLGYFEGDWYVDRVLLCFCDQSLENQNTRESKSLDSLSLDNAIKLVKEAGYKVIKEI